MGSELSITSKLETRLVVSKPDALARVDASTALLRS